MKAIEELLRNAGISPIAGVDEAGRGPCAGPLVVAAVILKDPFAPELAAVRDSKEVPESKVTGRVVGIIWPIKNIGTVPSQDPLK